MTDEARNYIIKNYPTGDYDKMIADLRKLGMRINKKSSLRVMASVLGVKRSECLNVEARREALLKTFQNDRLRIAAGLSPLTKKIKPYKMTCVQYEHRKLMKRCGYILTRSNMFSIGIGPTTYRNETLEQKGTSLGFNFYGFTDNT